MPLTTDKQRMELSHNLVQALDNISGVHPGHRPAHAKGIMLTGIFKPAPQAASLTQASHLHRETTPVTVRFSNSGGLPNLPDNDPHASPRGIAIRFHLAERTHTDIIGHSHNGFPVQTAEEFLEFLHAISANSATKPTAIESFLASHPKALAFVQAPKPFPTSFAKEKFFGVNAFKFTNNDGDIRFGRYRILPEGGTDYLEQSSAESKSANFLHDEIIERVKEGPVKFQIFVQLAEAGDVTNDATESWSEERTLLPFGEIVLTEIASNDDAEKRRIIFDPIPRVAGIDASDDPLLEPRADVYLLSGKRRREANRD